MINTKRIILYELILMTIVFITLLLKYFGVEFIGINIIPIVALLLYVALKIYQGTQIGWKKWLRS